MKALLGYVALAVAATLIGLSPIIGGADTTVPAAAPADRPKAEERRAHSNSPHPAVLSFEHPVYPIGVPLPPVSLERY